MPLRKISSKFRVGLKVFREQGFLGFTITSLQFMQKNIRSRQGASVQKQTIYTKASWGEVVRADLKKPLPAWPGVSKKQLRFNWLMPPPGKGSGGHMTLFRFIKYLEEAGHESALYFYVPGAGRGSIKAVKAIMGESFPPLRAKMHWIIDGEDMAPADGIFATSWETAYPIYNSSLSARRFYFVQDFEPLFYPVGSLSVLAENTYRMGFYGVTAGGWLAQKLNRDYGMETDYFTFGSDSKVYKLTNESPRKEVVFYARPYTERRGFELGVMALDIFHRKHPQYMINFIGWDVSHYDIPFPYNNLKILEHEELNELYNRCAAGLVMSLTNMSLLPLELLSCGAIPVVNDGQNNRLVSDNPYIAYAQSDPASLAESLSLIVARKDLTAYARKAADSAQLASWDESGAKFVKIIERETRRAP